MKYINLALNLYPQIFTPTVKDYVLTSLNDTYKNRHYHSLVHIEDCIKVYFELREKYKNSLLNENDEKAMIFTILFHDAIYGAGQEKSDEELSAIYAKEVLEKIEVINGEKYDFINQVVEMIEFTEHTKLQNIPKFSKMEVINLMIDIDLSILAENEKRYNEYTKDVRQEYLQYTDKQYFAGRKNILEMLKEKAENKTLFKTEWFQHKNEMAIKNLSKEIDEINHINNIVNVIKYK